MPFEFDQDGTLATVPDGDRGRRIPTPANLAALGEGSGITVDNTVDPPEEVTTIQVEGATFPDPGTVILPGGGSFTGGTITTPLNIDSDETGNLALLVQSPDTAASGITFIDSTNVAGQSVFAVSTNGRVEMTYRHTDGYLQLWQRLAGQTERPFRITNSSSVKVFSVLVLGAPVIRQNAAPADADIAANEMAIWFDSTNGAAKLMIKGKSADGTVVTGNVALT